MVQNNINRQRNTKVIVENEVPPFSGHVIYSGVRNVSGKKNIKILWIGLGLGLVVLIEPSSDSAKPRPHFLFLLRVIL